MNHYFKTTKPLTTQELVNSSSTTRSRVEECDNELICQ